MAAPLSATPPLTGFDLQPEPTPTPTRDVTGPIDREAPQPGPATPTPASTPRPTRPAASPVPAAPRPALGPTVAPTVRPTPASAPRQTPRPTPRQTIAPAATPNVAQTVAPRAEATPAPDIAEPAQDVAPLPSTSPTTTAIDNENAATAPQPSATTEPAWPWWLVGGLALGGLALVALLLLRRKRKAPPPAQPETLADTPVQPSPPAPSAKPTAAPAAANAVTQPLRIDAEAVSLGRSFANATLTYAVTVSNLGTRALANLRIAADMTTAHSGAALDDQLATLRTALPNLATEPALAVGAPMRADGVFRLPLNEVRLIRQGKAPLFVPLMRVRVEADGMEPVVRTFVIGRKPAMDVSSSLSTPTGRLEPFRLDETAQTYRDIAVRPLD